MHFASPLQGENCMLACFPGIPSAAADYIRGYFRVIPPG